MVLYIKLVMGLVKMDQQVNKLDPEPDNLSLVSEIPHMEGRTGSHRLPSGLHIRTSAYGCTRAYKLTYTNKCVRKLKLVISISSYVLKKDFATLSYSLLSCFLKRVKHKLIVFSEVLEVFGHLHGDTAHRA